MASYQKIWVVVCCWWLLGATVVLSYSFGTLWAVDARSTSVERSIIHSFFDHLNQQEWEQAHALTDHSDWGNLSRFKMLSLWRDNHDFLVVNSEPYDHYDFGICCGDTAFKVLLSYSDSSAQKHRVIYDFLLGKSENGQLRVCRVLNPKFNRESGPCL